MSEPIDPIKETEAKFECHFSYANQEPALKDLPEWERVYIACQLTVASSIASLESAIQKFFDIIK